MIGILPLDSIIQFLTALAALAVIALLWKNRKAPEVVFLILIELNVAMWAFFLCQHHPFANHRDGDR